MVSDVVFGVNLAKHKSLDYKIAHYVFTFQRMSLLDAMRGGGKKISSKMKVKPLARASWYLGKDILCQ